MSEETRHERGIQTFYTSLISGGIAGLVVDIVLYPIDTIKTRLQSEKGLWRSGGFRGVYNGIGAVAAGSAPTAALFFCTYETIKKTFTSEANQYYAPYIHMGAASIGEMVACLIRVPVEVAKQRRQTISSKTSSISILMEAYQIEGVRRGLYRGYGSTILREVPFAFIQFPIWEHLKANWTTSTGLELTPAAVAVCGAVAGGIAAAMTTPLDVAKTRIMLAEKNLSKRLTVTSVLRSVYKDGGVTGLFAGFVPRVLWITIGGAVFFGSYDLASRWLHFHGS
ncbi:S-adenosylmethionine mitochondrial carrier protein like [Pseudolycoriella hygida]|uniref:S-adenosylmethionine mitochondrial carrier protein like n=1 Tax=Pseudolycoriella hygida TaxID=35572 RepID=A0A9Q0RVC1_9DIPT|nr:S-adenosylmethionine mitochondrial carrier protein like [Pseudolycoriella hygida]